ncbi:MAG: isoprenyl transferase [Rhodospirillales bacterium]
MKTALKHSDLTLPVHVAVIMDGNGRWARSHNVPRNAGHQRGAKSAKTAVQYAIDMGIPYLTLYGFSSENWKRPAGEISDLMGLLRFYLRNEVKSLLKNGVRLRVIGELDRLDPDIVNLIADVEEQTASNTALNLTIALSYGGRTEITIAARRLCEEVKAGKLKVEDIDEDMFSRYLFTKEIPDPDLLIRTSGEKRISNFLIWQLAYAEFVFVDTLWPDFSSQDFQSAIDEFQRRERRYGASGV